MTLHHLQPSHTNALSFTTPRDETLRLDVLEQDIVRLRFYPDKQPRLDRTWLVVDETGNTPLEGRSRDDLSPFACPSYHKTEIAEQVSIATDKLKLIVNLRDARLEWQTAEGIPFAGDLRYRAYTYDKTGRAIYHYMERRTDELYYGLGEVSGDLDKYGRRIRLMNVDALGYNAETTDPLYKHIPFYITYIPSLKIAYGLFYDNLATTVFDLGHEIDAFWGNYRYYMVEDGDLDYYMLYGATIADVVHKYTRLTGRPALLPRYALGYLGSTMKYTEMPDAQAQLKRFVELCEQHDIPCDAFHLSSGYTTNATGQRFVFTWNHHRVPEPQQMVDDFHAAGIRLIPNIKPYLLTTHPKYESLKALGGFIKNPDTGEPALCRFWSGGAYESGEGAYVDFSSEAGFTWWRDQAQMMLLALGIDGLWNDNNEFELWDDEAVGAGFGQPLRMGVSRPLQTLLMARSSYAASLAQYPQKRPFILSRAACAGMQRYVQTWSGDNETSWHTLRYNVPMGLSMGLAGMPNIGHDIGGFFGPAPDAELFVRWVQNGIFHPRFTIHSWNTDGTVNEPWMHPEVLPIIRDTIKLRYRLLPYLYTLMVEAHRTGTSIIRPLVYHFPDDPRCWRESFDFLLGEHLLVASVFEPGARTRRVYLPAGKAWCDFYSGQWYDGGQEIEADAPLEKIPLFVAEGGMIPMGKIMRYVGEQPDNEREILVFVRDSAQMTLIEDDGETLAYQNGIYTELELRVTLKGGQWVASASVTKNGFPLAYDEITFVIITDTDYPVKNGILENGRWRVTLPIQ
jgi:alpha-glucosidase